MVRLSRVSLREQRLSHCHERLRLPVRVGDGAGHGLGLLVLATSAMLSLLVWLMFGVVAVVPALTDLTWQTVLYAAVSLTVIRMLPVAVALAGTRPGPPAVLFTGWFGPRGLASVVFALLALEDLGEAAARPALTVIAFTVLLSILAHGLSADPLASRYGPRLTPPPGAAGPVRPAEIPARPLIRRQSAQGTGELLMSADQILRRAGRRRRTGFPRGRVRVR